METTAYDFIPALLNTIYTTLASVGLVSILKIILLIFFFVYLYRILKDFSMFSEVTCGVLAIGLTAIFELVFGLFNYLASIFASLFLFLGEGLGMLVSILVVLTGLLVLYYIVSRATYWFRKKRIKREEEEEELGVRAGRKFYEITGKAVTGRKAGTIAAIADKLKSLWGISPPVKKKK